MFLEGKDGSANEHQDDSLIEREKGNLVLFFYLRKAESWSSTGKASGSIETSTRGEHPVSKDQFTHA